MTYSCKPLAANALSGFITAMHKIANGDNPDPDPVVKTPEVRRILEAAEATVQAIRNEGGAERHPTFVMERLVPALKDFVAAAAMLDSLLANLREMPND